MRSSILSYSFQFVFLILIQVLVANRVLLWDVITPYVALFFVISLPVELEKWIQLLACFLLGLCIDFFENSGGANAAALVVAIYIKPYVIRLFYRGEETLRELYFTRDKPLQFLGVLLVLIVSHHLTLFLLEFYSLSFWKAILKFTLWNTVFTLIILLLSVAIFRSKSSSVI